ncbi:MAG: hypothetical protein Kow0029_27660 [Candidatus Rifleibacteriota bacterium]
MSLKITSANFAACITSKDGLPDDNLPIIALVGRSNVGKSSLINAIAGRKELARTSSLPGKTLTINFYNINEQFYIVDLPGYGYAKASKVTRQQIQRMMNEFFGECKNLKAVIQILDVRHKPSALDRQMHEWLRDQKFNYLSVITKTDKLSNQQVLKMKKVILKEMGLQFALMFSAKSLIGKEEFLDALEKILAGFQFKSSADRPAALSKKTGSGNERGRSSKRQDQNKDNRSVDKKQAENKHEKDKPGQNNSAGFGNGAQSNDGSEHAGKSSSKRRRRRNKHHSKAKNGPEKETA